MSKNKNKKKFSDGLDFLLSNAMEEKTVKPSDDKSTPPAPRNTKKDGSKKSFSSDLEYFFQDAIEDAVQEAAQDISNGGTAVAKQTKRRTKPNFGIDSLIRSTIETSTIAEKQSKKRITFTFEEERIKQLKELAKLEKSRVRDIVGELIAQYIKENKGKKSKKKK